MRILITGATGFLGNNIVRQLLADSHEIVAATRLSSDPRPLDGLNIQRLNLDLNDASTVNAAVSDCDIVIHSAAMIHVGWKNLDASRRANVETTQLLAIAARRKHVRMIHVSTVDTLAAASNATTPNDETQTEPTKPACAYVVSKREAEQAFLAEVEQGLDGLIVQPGFMVGPFDWKPSSGKMMLMLNQQPVLFFAPAGGCSVVDVRDVAAGIASAIEHGRSGHRYLLAGANLSYLDLWARMARVMNRRPPVRAMSNPLAHVVGRCGDVAAWLLRRELEVNSASTAMGQLFHYYSSEKATRELGYQIGSIDDALRDGWEFLKRQHRP